jgi:hypothetical protein
MANALKEYSKGNYTELKNKKDIDNYVDKLATED